MSKSHKRLCSKCWTEITDEDEEAAYLGLSVEALRAIRNYPKPKVFRRRKSGNKYVKFRQGSRRCPPMLSQLSQN